MTPQQKPKRRYRKVTARTVAEHEAAKLLTGNATAAVREIDPTIKDPNRRAQLIALKARELDAGEYIDHKMQQIGIEAIERVESMVQSSDERIATKNSHFIIDHVRGKALQRSETKHLNLNIEAVLE